MIGWVSACHSLLLLHGIWQGGSSDVVCLVALLCQSALMRLSCEEQQGHSQRARDRLCMLLLLLVLVMRVFCLLYTLCSASIRKGQQYMHKPLYGAFGVWLC